MRKLASIQRITALEPIAGKDKIVLATILGWHVIVQKDQFEVGDLCVYCEIDSVMPQREEFAFLESKHYHIKTMKMAGVISQGIAFPLSILPERKEPYQENEDVTEVLGVKKYEGETEYLPPPNMRRAAPKKWYQKIWLMRFEWYRKLVGVKHAPNTAFPTEYVRKTDETRIQSAPFYLTAIKQPWILTEKVDGTSGTFLLVRKGKRFDYYVCSRNMRIPEPDGSIYWEVSERYHIREVLERLLRPYDKFVCIQGECIGPGVQKNKYKRKGPEFYAFNLIRGERGLTNSIDAKDILGQLGIPFVPIVDVAEILPQSVDEMLEKAHGNSKLCPDTLREGLVCRTWDAKYSFKAVDPLFLLKWSE